MSTPSRRNRTPTTPTLSPALAVTLTEPVTVAPAIGAVTVTVGGVVSAAAWVVALAAVERADSFPAASVALTAYVYAVEGVSPVSWYTGDVGVATCDPLRYTLYPATPTLSVEAVQLRLTWLDE